VKNRKKSLILLLLLFAVALQAQRNPAAELLAKASRLGDLKSAETLVSAGVDPNLPNQYGWTPLYYAALFNRNDVVALLLAHAADPNIRAGGEAGSEFPQTARSVMIPLRVSPAPSFSPGGSTSGPIWTAGSVGQPTARLVTASASWRANRSEVATHNLCNVSKEPET